MVKIAIDPAAALDLQTKDNVRMVSITTLGRDDPSKADDELRGMIYDRLSGRETSRDGLVERVPVVEIIWDKKGVEEMALEGETGTETGGAGVVPPSTLPKSVRVRLNASQRTAVHNFCFAGTSAFPTPTYKKPRLQLVQGPPGSGKTTLIAAMVQWLASTTAKVASRSGGGGRSGSASQSQGQTGPDSRGMIYLVSQSNVAVRNIAVKLHACGFKDFRLVVSAEFKQEW